MLKCGMRRRFVVTSVVSAVIFATLIVALAGRSLAASDKETTAARKMINAAYARQDAAATRKDAEGYMGERTKDFVWISKNGKRKGYTQIKAETARMFRQAESVNGSTTIEKITLQGANKATVLIRDAGTIVIRVSDREKRVVKVTERASSTWLRRDGRWLCSQSKTLSTSVTVNGKPVAQ